MRTLSWDGCVNVRDLGGLPTEDGAVTRFGRVVRADSVRGLTDAGWEALVGHGVSRIVDLRWADELAEDEPRDVPVDVVHVELLGERDGPFAEIDRRQRRLGDPTVRRRTGYTEFLESFPANFAEAVTAVAEAPEGAVVVHCAGGVDRTGLVAAFLLRLAGVGLREIGLDYAESERNWAPHVGSWIDEAPDGEEREFRRMLSRCPPEAITGVLEEVEARYGDVHAYLSEAGAPKATLAAARARLLDP
jgi:protein tyrosine/serine phosphatase